MRRATVVMSAAAMVFGAVTAFAQAPSFAGHWMLQVDPNAAPPAGGGGGGGRGGRGGGFGGGGACGMDCTITQDAKTVVITRSMNGTDTKVTYNLDGSDSHNALTMGGRGGGGGGGGGAPATMDQVSKAKWDGAKLVITTTTSFNGNDMTTTTTWSMDAGNMKVETSRPGMNGGAAMTTTATYKKG